MANFRSDRCARSARWCAWGVCALIVAGLGAVSAAARAAVITSQAVATFTDSKAGYLGAFTNQTFPIFSDGFSDSIGGIYSGVGAQASGSVSATLGGFVEAFWSPTYSYAYSSKNSIQLNWAGDKPSVGDSFFLQASATPLGWGKVTLEDQGFKGAFGLRESVTAAASAKGCLGGCVELGLSLNLVQEQKLAALLGGALLVLGQNVGNVLPYTYTSSDNTLTLHVGAPNFSAPLNVAGKTGPATHTSTQTLASGAVDVAQLIANLVGLPIPLSGDVGGFGYTLIEALVGLGIDLERWFSLQADKLLTSLTFSAPVVVSTDGVNWSEPKTSFTPDPNTPYEIRPVSSATALGVVPSYGFYTNLEASLDLVPFVSGSVRALEVHGHGVSFGPLLDEQIKQPIAHFEIDSYQTQRSKWVTGKPINLTFDPIVVDANNQPIDTLCPNPNDCLATGFIPVTSAREGGWNSGEIVLARNMAGACLAGILDDPDSPCDIDPAFTPLRSDFREGASRTDPTEFTPRYNELLAILGAPDPVSGPESNAAMLEASVRDAIARLGFDPDADGFPRRAPPGDPPPTESIVGNTVYAVNIAAVPEPGTLALLAIGVILLPLARAHRASRA